MNQQNPYVPEIEQSFELATRVSTIREDCGFMAVPETMMMLRISVGLHSLIHLLKCPR